MKKAISVIWAVMLIITSSVFLSSESNAVNVTKRGQEAIQQIATCINSDTKTKLNVLYLIDDSASLRTHDPSALRADGLIRSIEQFRDVTETKPYFTINRAFTTFGDTFRVLSEWKKLDSSQLSDDVKWISSNIPNLNRGQYTDWEEGLRGSLALFKKIQSSDSCNVMVWFTDGGIQVSDSLVQTSDSVARICGIDPLSGAKISGKAIIDQFRDSGINIQGVLLRNTDYFKEPEKFKSNKSTAENELARMSYFFPVVEQEANTLSNAFGDEGGRNFRCGSDGGAKGVVQIVSDAIDIIWPPIEFSCLSSNGRLIPIAKDGSIQVDAALTSFIVSAPSERFNLTNGDGSLIANDKGAVKGDVKTNFASGSQKVIQISGEISKSSSVTTPGIWKLKSSDIDRSVFCGFLDVDISVKAGTCYQGEKCDYFGTLTRFGKPVSFEDFKSFNITAELLDAKGFVNNSQKLAINANDSSFGNSFTSSKNSKIANLRINFNALTATGIEFSTSTIKQINVIPAGLYPEVTPAPITAEAFTQDLIGRNGEALANLVLKAPSRSTGEICFGGLKVRNDVNPNRIEKYVATIDGKTLGDDYCVTLMTGTTRDSILSIKNSDSADGKSTGYIDLTLKSDGQPDLKTRLDVQFNTSTLVDEGKFGLLFGILMFLGIALPLALLSLLNLRNSRLTLDNVYLAQVPVQLSSSGEFINISRKENIQSGDLLSTDDFSPFSSGKEVVREKNIGVEKISGITPINPFGNLKAELEANPGTIIVSSAFSNSHKSAISNIAPAELNPSGLIYVTLPASDLLLLQNDLENGKSVEAKLTALLSLNSADPIKQVEYLNTKIKHEGGWLNKLSQSEVLTPKVKEPKKEKTRMKEQSAPSTGAPAPVDEWGSPSSTQSSPQSSTSETSSNKKVDDWGSSGSSSDWDSPGSFGDSKDEW